MLRLTRKQGEGFAIDEQTYVWIVRTKSGRCELAIDAPREIRIRRCELETLPGDDRGEHEEEEGKPEIEVSSSVGLNNHSDCLNDELVAPDYTGFAHPAHQPIRPS